MLERSCISSLLGEIDYYPHKITETTIVIMETLSGLGPMRFYFLSWEGFSMINILGIIILFLFYFFYLLIIFAGIDFVSIRKSENLYYFSNIIRPNISRSGTYYALLLGYFGMKFLPDIRHCVYWVLAEIWAPDSSHKIGNKFFIHHCQGWKEGSFLYEVVRFFSWVNTHPFDLKPVAFFPKFSGDSWVEFKEKTIQGEFFRNFVQTKGLYRNLWNFNLISSISFRVRIGLKKFTQVLSYVVCTQVRRHVDKQITKRRYGEENPGRFVFENLVLFNLGLGLTTPYSLGSLVWNFYQTFFTVSFEFWLRFEPYIRTTRLEINFYSSLPGLKGMFVCVWSFRGWILIRFTWNLSCFVPNAVAILYRN